MAKKGFVFTMDATIAVFIVIAALIIIEYYSVQAEKSPYAKLQLERMGNDALIILDEDGSLHSFNSTLISQDLNNSLPEDTYWHITLSAYTPNENNTFDLIGVSDFGYDVPSTVPVYVISRDFFNVSSVIANGTSTMQYCTARLKIWRD